MTFLFKPGARPTIQDLNDLLDEQNIEETQYQFEKLFGDNYQLGHLAALIPGISGPQARQWRRVCAKILPLLMQRILRDVIHDALTDPNGPIPIKLIYGTEKGDWGVKVSTIGLSKSKSSGASAKKRMIIIEMNGIPRPALNPEEQAEGKGQK